MNTIKVFTDGSNIKGRRNLGGYGIYFPNGELPNISRKFSHPPITNQRAELYAIYVALILIKKNLEYDKVIIYTDSDYSIKTLTKWAKQWEKNDWKTANNEPAKNLDIIKPLMSIIKKMSVEFTHVHSHTGKRDELSLGNAIADKLATDGAKS